MLYDTVVSQDFAMIPRAEIPRSVFKLRHSHKTTFDAGLLIPVYVEEVVPGDEFRGSMNAVCRLATPIVPFMDDLYLESFFFFVPTRILWRNFKKMHGERDNPSDSIAFTVPQVTGQAGSGFPANSLGDYFGLPTAGQWTNGTISVSAIPFRAYNRIYNEWFRDQNLQSQAFETVDDAAASFTSYPLRRRGKRHDYFTSCLPWPQKGSDVLLPLGSQVPIRSAGVQIQVRGPSGSLVGLNTAGTANSPLTHPSATGAGGVTFGTAGTNVTSIYADLSSATSATINAIRLAFQTQRLLERDARGGTRYTELILSHFGVRSPDMRLQRPEYIGGGSTPIVINGVAQTSATGLTGSTTPAGNLAAVAAGVTRGDHSFNVAATEHGYIIGLVNVRGELTYQQGIRRHWSRLTRYDFYYPVFAGLGEQAVLNKEIYAAGDVADNDVFGYQERWGEMRHHPSMITGLFRSTTAGTIDLWHLSQRFTSLPTLNSTFIEENPPIDRVIAVPSSTGKQFLFDSLFDVTAVRPLPAYGVPGMLDHF